MRALPRTPEPRTHHQAQDLQPCAFFLCYTTEAIIRIVRSPVAEIARSLDSGRIINIPDVIPKGIIALKSREQGGFCVGTTCELHWITAVAFIDDIC